MILFRNISEKGLRNLEFELALFYFNNNSNYLFYKPSGRFNEI